MNFLIFLSCRAVVYMEKLKCHNYFYSHYWPEFRLKSRSIVTQGCWAGESVRDCESEIFGEANVAHRQRWKISTSSACVPKHIIMLHDGRRPSLQGRLLHSLHRVVTDRWLSESRVGSVRWLVLSAESHVGILQMVKGVSPTKGFWVPRRDCQMPEGKPSRGPSCPILR